jgi:hypothetical protein
MSRVCGEGGFRPDIFPHHRTAAGKYVLIASKCNGRCVHQGVVKVGSSGSKGWKEKLEEDILKVLYRY